SEPAGGGCAPLRRDRRGHEGHDVPRACQEPINTFALTASILPEPHDRLERSSPGYRPGASPSTLAGQGTAATPPGDRRLADVRRAVCRRALHPPPPRHLVVDPDSPAYQAGVTGSAGWRREVATRIRSVIAEGGPAH